MTREHLIDLAKANGFSSVTEVITAARQSRAKVERLKAALHAIGHNFEAVEKAGGPAAYARAALDFKP